MDQLSPEDREILAKTKFKQWFDECWEETFGTAFDGRFNDVASLAGTSNESNTSHVSPSKPNAQTPPANAKRRSLFEMAFSDVFGM